MRITTPVILIAGLVAAVAVQAEPLHTGVHAPPPKLTNGETITTPTLQMTGLNGERLPTLNDKITTATLAMTGLNGEHLPAFTFAIKTVTLAMTGLGGERLPTLNAAITTAPLAMTGLRKTR